AEVFAFQLSQELRRHQHDVRIAYLYPYKGANRLPVEHPENILLDGSEGSFLEKVPGFHPLLLRRLNQRIADFKPDIVQANGARTVKYGAFAARKQQDHSSVLIYRNIGNPQDWLKGPLRSVFYQKFVMPRVDGIVGVSQKTLERVLNFYQLSIPSAHIPRGIDASALISTQNRQSVRKAYSIPEDTPLLIYLGSMTREKRPDRFLRIVRCVKERIPQIQAWLVGDGPLKEQLQKETASEGMTETVRFVGLQTQVAPFLLASDLLLVTSDTEGIPGVILEAGLLGIPAIASSVGGVPECIQNNRTGILVDPENEEAFATAVMELLQESSRRNEMGERAKDWMNQNFEIRKVALQYLEFYKKVLFQSSRS
ncbi:MAG: glycosyltransferase family 4 protein, partial [Acidobacteriota bacterium]